MNNNYNSKSGRGAISNLSNQGNDLTEQKVRQIVQEEIMRNYRSGTPVIPPHTHNGNDNLNVSQQDIVPSFRASGSITFSNIKRYTLNINSNPNPTLVLCYGIVVDNVASPTIRIHTFGTAELGRSYYFQPGTDSSVIPGPTQPFIQSSTYFSVANALGGVSPNQTVTARALTDEEDIVDVEYGGTIHARMTLIAFDKNTITLDVTHLDNGWSIIVNLVVI